MGKRGEKINFQANYLVMKVKYVENGGIWCTIDIYQYM